MSRLPVISATPGTPTGFANLAYSKLTGAAASIGFSGLSTSYKEFDVRGWVLIASSGQDLYLRPNNDTGASFDWQGFAADGATVSNSAATGQTATRANITAGYSNARPGSFRFMVYKNAAALEGMIHGSLGWHDTVPAIRVGQHATRWNNVANLISGFTVTTSSGNLSIGTTVTVFGLIP